MHSTRNGSSRGEAPKRWENAAVPVRCDEVLNNRLAGYSGLNTAYLGSAERLLNRGAQLTARPGSTFGCSRRKAQRGGCDQDHTRGASQ